MCSNMAQLLLKYSLDVLPAAVDGALLASGACEYQCDSPTSGTLVTVIVCGRGAFRALPLALSHDQRIAIGIGFTLVGLPRDRPLNSFKVPCIISDTSDHTPVRFPTTWPSNTRT